jgi:hypothetical protein
MFRDFQCARTGTPATISRHRAAGRFFQYDPGNFFT